MIPGQFSYHRPATLADAVNLLATLGEEARPLAGGHSLVPMMKLRLATPEHLVDLHGIAGLKGIRRDGNKLVIGAMTTQHELLASDEVAKSAPILHETALLIADPQVRYRGIRGGKVSDIRLEPDDFNNILITISVNDDVPLQPGTVAKLKFPGATRSRPNLFL